MPTTFIKGTSPTWSVRNSCPIRLHTTAIVPVRTTRPSTTNISALVVRTGPASARYSPWNYVSVPRAGTAFRIRIRHELHEFLFCVGWFEQAACRNAGSAGLSPPCPAMIWNLASIVEYFFKVLRLFFLDTGGLQTVLRQPWCNRPRAGPGIYRQYQEHRCGGV